MIRLYDRRDVGRSASSNLPGYRAPVLLMRCCLLVAIALGIPLLWAFVPYGRMAPDMMGQPGEGRTFAATVVSECQRGTT
jgi:hypothetical protein